LQRKHYASVRSPDHARDAPGHPDRPTVQSYWRGSCLEVRLRAQARARPMRAVSRTNE